MEYRLNTIKADLYNVFVEGNASSYQIAKVFVLIGFPIIGIFMWGLH